MPLQRDEEDVEPHQQRRNHDHDHDHYYEVSPERPAPWGAYLWQLLTSLSAAGIIGLTAWLFNIESRVAEIPNTQTQIARLEGGREGNRGIIDRNSDRLTKLESSLEQITRDRDDYHGALNAMSSDIRSIREAHQQLEIEITRMAETVRQLRDEISDGRGWQAPPTTRSPRPERH